MAHQTADDTGLQQERVPHPIILPGAQQTSFSNSQPRQPKAPKISSQLPEIPPYSYTANRFPPPADAPAMIPSIPHPPRRTLPNSTPPQGHKSQTEQRPQASNRLQFSGRPHAPKPIPTTHLPLGAHFPSPLQNPLLLNAQLSPAQLHAQRQQLITAYMLQSGGAAGLAQPVFFSGGGVPTTHPAPNPQAPIEGSPAPKYTQMEAIVAEMRENMLKVLKTSNYKRCKSAKNIRQALRQVRTLCKDIRNETTEMGKQKVNPRKKAPTPEGEEGPSKKHKGSEDKDAKNPEEGLKGDADVKHPEDVLETEEAGADGKEVRRQDDVGPREEGASREGAADAAERSPLKSDRTVSGTELQGQGNTESGRVYRSEDESEKEEVSDQDLPPE
ncbi:hypothetical protein KFL_000100540 [Klebsormidium nitens]|uniref:Uncharacterized protein n=1 Tax=Klebsormidium nitens TaxID=105231 RepID=A0A1Y1HM67_KLENI|nr:hypothetical protein KFL_000100540 [Klebsormidium nitens]|eukprot:GAQ78289.1 hypothetical protein KFL_000100540 [Klebsormidium nitens]